MLTRQNDMNKEEFYRFVALPENADRNFEYIAGEIVEAVSNSKSSLEAIRLVARVSVHVEDNNLGWVTGADGGYVVDGHDFIPDGAFISLTRQPEEPNYVYNPQAPDLAIEMLSPGNTQEEIAFKVSCYLAAGTTLWLGYPDKKIIDVLAPGKSPVRLHVGDTLEGGEVQPGFKIAIARIFGGGKDN